MAKVSKSKLIRDYVTKNSTATAKEVVAALAKKNVKVSIALVGNVKSKAGLTKSRKKKRGVGRPKKALNGQAVGQVSLDALVDAKRLIVKAGSAKQAIAMINAVEKLNSVA